MRTKTSLGILITLIGIVMTIYTAYTYVIAERIADSGPILSTKEENHPVQWSPIIGTTMLVGGIVIIIGARKEY